MTDPTNKQASEMMSTPTLDQLAKEADRVAGLLLEATKRAGKYIERPEMFRAAAEVIVRDAFAPHFPSTPAAVQSSEIGNALRAMWRHGVDTARSYGDNIMHLRDEQEDRAFANAINSSGVAGFLIAYANAKIAQNVTPPSTPAAKAETGEIATATVGTDAEPFDVDAIRKRAEAATPGPWFWSRCYELDGLHWALENPESRAQRMVLDYTLVLHHNTVDSMMYKPADTNPNWQFIAHARTDIPYLLSLVDALKRERDEARQEDARLHRLVDDKQTEIIRLIQESGKSRNEWERKDDEARKLCTDICAKLGNSQAEVTSLRQQLADATNRAEEELLEVCSWIAEGGDYDVYRVSDYPDKKSPAAEELRDYVVKKLASAALQAGKGEA